MTRLKAELKTSWYLTEFILFFVYGKNKNWGIVVKYLVAKANTIMWTQIYITFRGADKSLARPD